MRICNVGGPELSGSLESLAHYQVFASLSPIYRYYFGRCSSELSELAPLPSACGRSTRYSNRLHDFVVAAPIYSKEIYANSFLPRMTRL